MNQNYKQVAPPSVSQSFQAPIPRVPLRDANQIFEKETAYKAASATKGEDRPQPPFSKPTTLACDASSNASPAVKDAQELLYQLRQADSQPLRGFESDAKIPVVSKVALQPARQDPARRD